MTEHRKREFYPGKMTVVSTTKPAFDGSKFGIFSRIASFIHNFPDMMVAHAINNSSFYGTKKDRIQSPDSP
jgi:hypothetical protein